MTVISVFTDQPQSMGVMKANTQEGMDGTRTTPAKRMEEGSKRPLPQAGSQSNLLCEPCPPEAVFWDEV